MGNVKYFAKNSKILKHAWTHAHSIGFKNGHVIEKGRNRENKTLLKSMYTAMTNGA